MSEVQPSAKSPTKELLSCSSCPKTFQYKKSLKKHQKSCVAVSKTVRAKENISANEEAKDDPEDMSQDLSWVDNLEGSVVPGLSETRFSCQYCRSKFKSKAWLKKHAIKSHKDQTEKSALKKVKKVTPLKRPEKPNTFNALHNLIKSGLSKSKKKEAMADVDKSVSPIQKYRDFNMRNSKVAGKSRPSDLLQTLAKPIRMHGRGGSSGSIPTFASIRSAIEKKREGLQVIPVSTPIGKAKKLSQLEITPVSSNPKVKKEDDLKKSSYRRFEDITGEEPISKAPQKQSPESKDGTHICTVCNNRFAGLKNYNQHILTHLAALTRRNHEKVYSCDQCSGSFTDVKDYNRYDQFLIFIFTYSYSFRFVGFFWLPCSLIYWGTSER